MWVKIVNQLEVNQLSITEQRQSFLLEGGHYGDIPIAKNELPQGTRRRSTS
jgi:hypothetical protein